MEWYVQYIHGSQHQEKDPRHAFRKKHFYANYFVIK